MYVCIISKILVVRVALFLIFLTYFHLMKSIQ
jgi:hypothetical protein